MISCRSALSLIEPLLDSELDAARKADVEEHLRECPNCYVVFERLKRLNEDLRSPGLRYEAPERLRSEVMSGLRQAAGVAATPAPIRVSRRWPANSWAIAATALLAFSACWNLVLLRSQKSAGNDVTQQVVASHVRSMIGDHLLDIKSTDQHNVKPWFDGKLDYAPDVRDFAADGFPLIGGRVDYIDRRSVAALIYRHRQHVINLFVWPSSTAVRVPEAASGLSLVAWNKAGMAYFAISDLNRTELLRFADLYRR